MTRAELELEASTRVAAAMRHENVGTVEQRTSAIARRYWWGRSTGCARPVRIDGLTIVGAGCLPPTGLDAELLEVAR